MVGISNYTISRLLPVSEDTDGTLPVTWIVIPILLIALIPFAGIFVRIIYKRKREQSSLSSYVQRHYFALNNVSYSMFDHKGNDGKITNKWVKKAAEYQTQQTVSHVIDKYRPMKPPVKHVKMQNNSLDEREKVSVNEFDKKESNTSDKVDANKDNEARPDISEILDTISYDVERGIVEMTSNKKVELAKKSNRKVILEDCIIDGRRKIENQNGSALLDREGEAFDDLPGKLDKDAVSTDSFQNNQRQEKCFKKYSTNVAVGENKKLEFPELSPNSVKDRVKNYQETIYAHVRKPKTSPRKVGKLSPDMLSPVKVMDFQKKNEHHSIMTHLEYF
ncbi:uncharacterized protein LOC120340809 [Styela clava]